LSVSDCRLSLIATMKSVVILLLATVLLAYNVFVDAAPQPNARGPYRSNVGPPEYAPSVAFQPAGPPAWQPAQVSNDKELVVAVFIYL